MVSASVAQILVASSGCILVCALNVKVFGKLRLVFLFLKPVFHYLGRNS